MLTPRSSPNSASCQDSSASHALVIMATVNQPPTRTRRRSPEVASKPPWSPSKKRWSSPAPPTRPRRPWRPAREPAGRERPSSPSWGTSTMERRRCSTRSGRPTWRPARPAASPSTSVLIASRRRAGRSSSWTRRATRRLPRCGRAARRRRTSSCSWCRGRRRHAPDDRGNRSRAGGQGSDGRRDQQDRQEQREPRPGQKGAGRPWRAPGVLGRGCPGGGDLRAQEGGDRSPPRAHPARRGDAGAFGAPRGGRARGRSGGPPGSGPRQHRHGARAVRHAACRRRLLRGRGLRTRSLQAGRPRTEDDGSAARHARRVTASRTCEAGDPFRCGGRVEGPFGGLVPAAAGSREGDGQRREVSLDQLSTRSRKAGSRSCPSSSRRTSRDPRKCSRSRCRASPTRR